MLDLNLNNLNKGIEMERKNSSMRRRHNSMVVRGGRESQKWLQEYSGFNLQEIQESFISHAKKGSTYNHSEMLSQADALSHASGSHITSVTTSITAMLDSLEQNEEILRTVTDLDFDCFKVSNVLGRDHFFSIVVFKMLNDLPRSGQS